MNFDKNVYILGAGVSAPAGAPLISNFLNRIQDIYEDSTFLPSTSERQHFKRLLEYREEISAIRRKVKCNLENIEDLLGFLELDISWGQEKQQLRDDYVFTILKTLEITTDQYDLVKNIPSGTCGIHGSGKILGSIVGQNTKNGYLMSLYHLFAYLLRCNIKATDDKSQDTLITFNYDLLLDKAFYDVGMEVNYGPLDDITADLAKSNTEETKRVLYLKLHGSANFCNCSGCKTMHILSPHKSLLNDINQTSCQSCGKRELHPVIVPPVWNKYTYQQTFKGVWQLALEKLRAARRIVIIGYSMPQTDMFFSYLMKLGYKSSVEKKLILVNPDSDVEKSCKYILDDYYQDDYHFTYSALYCERLFQSGSFLQAINRKFKII